jgi:hypothetical protein
VNIFNNIQVTKLREIFDLVKNVKHVIPKSEVVILIETFFKEFVYSIQLDYTRVEDFMQIIENLRCVHSEFGREFKDRKFGFNEIFNGSINRDN